MTPNKENIRLWVNALRSGNYLQGTDYLAIDGRFCCLGVACEVAIANGLKIDVQEPLVELAIAAKHYDDHDVSLPRSVMDWLGMNRPSPVIGEQSYELAWLNDEGMSFTEIADLIEQEWLSEEED